MRAVRGFKLDRKPLFHLLCFMGALTLFAAFNLRYPSLKLVHAKALALAPAFLSMAWLFSFGMEPLWGSDNRYIKSVSRALTLVVIVLMVSYDGFLIYAHAIA